MLLPLSPVIQNYPWGSTTAIAELLGANAPSEKPEAELWLGAHPQGPAGLTFDGRSTSLDEALKEHQLELLGRACAVQFGTLPFLFKALAAAKPLSIQLHPNKQQAVAGFARENAAGIPLTARQRNYRDDNHKPEIICALTPMVALSGFRQVQEVLTNCCGLDTIAPELRTLATDHDLARFFAGLLQISADRRQALLSECRAAAERDLPGPLAASWVRRLAAAYPDDVGAVMPLILNLTTLLPKQALATEAGVPHAYLDGFGIELMANSNNVLRGGLTQKHVDVPELLRCLDGDPRPPLLPEPDLDDHEWSYPTTAKAFQLSRFELTGKAIKRSPTGPEILLCTAGSATISDAKSTQQLHQGQALFVAATTPVYQVDGKATIFRAAVPNVAPVGKTA